MIDSPRARLRRSRAGCGGGARVGGASAGRKPKAVRVPVAHTCRASLSAHLHANARKCTQWRGGAMARWHPRWSRLNINTFESIEFPIRLLHISLSHTKSEYLVAVARAPHFDQTLNFFIRDKYMYPAVLRRAPGGRAPRSAAFPCAERVAVHEAASARPMVSCATTCG